MGARATAGELPPLRPLSENYEAEHEFTDYANWLIPGALLLGRYPYVEPSRCRTRQQGEAQLSQIARAGVTTYVCLQAELPDQREMRLAGSGGFLPYLAIASLQSTALAPPPSLEETEGLRNAYLDKFLPPRSPAARRRHRAGQLVAPDQPSGGNGASAAVPAADSSAANGAAPAAAAGGTMDGYGDAAAAGAGNGAASGGRKRSARPAGDLGFVYSPIEDLGVPTKLQVAELVEALERHLRAGEVLYIHCWGGRGRAGTVGACLLGHLYGLPAEEALVRVQRAFDTRKDDGRNSPETQQQVEFVRSYLETHGSRARTSAAAAQQASA